MQIETNKVMKQRRGSGENVKNQVQPNYQSSQAFLYRGLITNRKSGRFLTRPTVWPVWRRQAAQARQSISRCAGCFLVEKPNLPTNGSQSKNADHTIGKSALDLFRKVVSPPRLVADLVRSPDLNAEKTPKLGW